MDKKVLLLIGAVIVVLGIGGAIFLLNNQSNPVSSDELADLIAQGAPLECDVEESDNQSTSVGRIYLAGERMRATITTTDDQSNEYILNLLNDGVYSYTWGNMPFFGEIALKVEVSEDDPEEDVIDVSDPEGINCRHWRLDESMFQPPADMEFGDAEDLFNLNDQDNLFTGEAENDDDRFPDPTDMDEILAEQCNACDQSDYPDMCRQVLGCQ